MILLIQNNRYNIRGTTELALITGSAAVCRYASTVPAVAGRTTVTLLAVFRLLTVHRPCTPHISPFSLGYFLHTSYYTT